MSIDLYNAEIDRAMINSKKGKMIKTTDLPES